MVRLPSSEPALARMISTRAFGTSTYVTLSNPQLAVKSNLEKCCSPNVPNNGGWGIFNAILGWTNSATYGSVISYNLYWLCVMIGFIVMRFREVHGHYPLMKAKAAAPAPAHADDSSESQVAQTDKNTTNEKTTTV